MVSSDGRPIAASNTARSSPGRRASRVQSLITRPPMQNVYANCFAAAVVAGAGPWEAFMSHTTPARRLPPTRPERMSMSSLHAVKAPSDPSGEPVVRGLEAGPSQRAACVDERLLAPFEPYDSRVCAGPPRLAIDALSGRSAIDVLAGADPYATPDRLRASPATNLVASFPGSVDRPPDVRGCRRASGPPPWEPP